MSEATRSGVSSSTYDIANRLTSVDGVDYTWDANGNLLRAGLYTYTYNVANRLVGVSGAETAIEYRYNGLGDRVSETVNGHIADYWLDLNGGLTQVLAGASITYLYGVGRIAQADDYGGVEYYLGDALGSMRQLADLGGAVTLEHSYTPYGEVESRGGASSNAFTGEWVDAAREVRWV